MIPTRTPGARAPLPATAAALAAALLLLVAATAAPGAHAAKKKATEESDEEKPKWDVATSEVGPTRTMRWTVEEGTWMHLDVSPDGRTIVFDLLGDLYALPIEGGEAKRLRGGRSYDVQPRFSPDGAWISFTSDAGGGDNIWVMRADGSDARQVTEEDFRLLNNATWMPDGRSIVARKHFTSRRSLGAGEMWLYDVRSGGAGVQLTERPTDQKDVGEPEISPDGRWLYYSLDATPGESFEYNKDPNGTIYEIRRLDLATGRTETVVSVAGGSVRPELSPDGEQLAYVRRVRGKSVLMVRDLAAGRDRMVHDALYRDQQETWAIFGPYPGFAWTPDGASIVIWGRGKLLRVDAAGGGATEIPFRAAIEQDVVEPLRFPIEVGGDALDVKNLRWPRVSPDGARVVFQALGALWIRDLDAPAGSRPRRLTAGTAFEYHPAWSPDGARIAFTTWDDVEGGRVVVAPADGGAARVVVERPGHYVEPAWSPDGREIVYRRAGADGYRGDLWTTETGVYVVDAAGGREPRLVTRSGARPRFVDGGERIELVDFGRTKTLYTVDRLGGDRRELATSERAMELVPSPDGRWIAFEELWEVWVAPLPAAGGPVAVGPTMKNLPVRKVSEVAGEYLDWSADGRTLRFGLGPDLYAIEVAPLFERKPGEETGARPAEPAKKTKKSKAAEKADDGPKPERVALGWSEPTEPPATDVVLVGATILTMDGDRVIEDGAVHVRGERIVAVGPRDAVAAPGAKRIDVSGKTIVPGYVDVHAHTGSSGDGMHAQTSWAFLANLAFGVTTTHDPSNDTGMIQSARELVEAGRTLGPRVYSTGTILYGAEGDFKAPIESREDAARHLKRLAAYGGWSAKSYNQPRRDQRQWVLREARDLGMLVVPEGGSTFHHNMTMFLDGHTTLEHALPLAPLYEDTLHLVAESGVGYTPTLVVGYGGLWGENYWYQEDDVWTDERLLDFVPREIVDARSRRRVKVPENELYHRELAAVAAEVVRRGGIAEVGAHGQMQGIAVHWEMWMFAQGGLAPLDVLRVGTILGARSIGLDRDLGSIEEGKLADLLVLDADPREDIRNTAAVGRVMLGGRLYDARTLEQLEPVRRPRPAGPPLNSIPRDAWDAGCLSHATSVSGGPGEAHP